MAEASLSLLNELISEEDEDTKIEEIQKNTNRLLWALIKVILLFILAFALGSIPLFTFAYFTEADHQTWSFTSLYSIIAISVGASIPFFVPLRKTSDYSELSQLLHRLILDNFNISERLFRWEQNRMKKVGLASRKEFVIVTGLARAGTTSLMLNLSKIEGFASLSYANMPFLTAPNLWKKIYRPKSKRLKERSHQDGIKIGLDSNEALEEYFFKMRANDAFIQDNALVGYAPSANDYKAYLDYQSVVKGDNHKVYLAKNNNFILRYHALRQLNDSFVMVVLFRDPITHAASLLDKHLYYSKAQKEDPFILEYMNWLGHHEFGLNQKPFVFEKENRFTHYKKDTLDYWLYSWINYYKKALEMQHANTVFVNYSEYCTKPNDVLSNILEKVGMKINLSTIDGFQNRRKSELPTNAALLQEANDVFKRLIEISRQ